jgi:hypothetical protein
VQIDILFGRRLKVITTNNPTHPGSSAGVAFVLNKEDCKHHQCKNKDTDTRLHSHSLAKMAQ